MHHRSKVETFENGRLSTFDVNVIDRSSSFVFLLLLSFTSCLYYIKIYTQAGRESLPRDRHELLITNFSSTQKREKERQKENILKKYSSLFLHSSQGHTSIDSTSPDENSSSGKTPNDEEDLATAAAAVVAAVRPQEDGEDILAALEKIPGVGSLRSVAHSSSIGSSLPSLSLTDQGGGNLQQSNNSSSTTSNKVKREESSQSLRSQVRKGIIASSSF